MKRLLAIIFLAVIVFGAYWFFFKKDTHQSQPKQEAIKINKHSDVFNHSISNAVDGYLGMKNAFVDADTSQIKMQAQKFITLVDSMNLDDLNKDDPQILSAARQEVSDIKANADALLLENDITEMRQDFRMISENMYPFLRTIAYEGPKLYWQNCPMAFGENKEANWISNSPEIINPYLGKHDPVYKSSMVGCGETKDSLQ
ncbi:MAG: DUF3347 domain-containing protein [Ginsengibacter sp.]